MKTLSWVAIFGAVLVGIGMIVVGSLFVAMGMDARGEIREALRKEKVITSKDATIPGVLVEDVATARAQQDVIEDHTFGRFGPYSGMERDDPNRDVYLKGLTLRNALNLAIVGFSLADMAIGLGAVTIMLGLMTLALAAPIHWLFIRKG